MLTNPWARVSWMSRARRWRSARRPPSRSAAASSLRVASSCSISSRRSWLCSMIRVIRARTGCRTRPRAAAPIAPGSPQRPARDQHLAPDDRGAERDRRFRDGLGQAQVAEDLQVEDQQQREVDEVDPGQQEPQPEHPGQVDHDQPWPLLLDPEPPEREVPGGQGLATQPDQRPALAGAGRVEQGQEQGQGEQAVEGGVPDPRTGPRRRPRARARSPAGRSSSSPPLRMDGTRGRGGWGAPDGGSAGQPFG